MTSISFARPAIPLSAHRALILVSAAVAVTALADFLFFRHAPGVSIAIFAAALCAAALLTNPVRASWTRLAAAAAVLAGALAPAIEDFNLLSLVFAVAGACVFVLIAAGWSKPSAMQRFTDVVWMIFSGPFRLVGDLGAAFREARERQIARLSANWLVAWIVPAVLGSAFLVLFAQANPLIEQWLTSFDTSHVTHFDLVRPLFWLAVIVLTWPFLQARTDGKPAMKDVVKALDLALSEPLQAPAGPADAEPVAEPVEEPAEEEGPLFGRTAILRSLILFNALFAVQSVLDATYLWGGLALPAGMTYAAYAHRGAYPLIITALMAGAFVLAAMQPGSDIARSCLARALVFVWIGQNVLLVLSSILRLELYVEVYSLTEWRCAAFVWMLLVAAGLALIVARIVLDRSNRWLVWANAAAVALALYVCSLVDFSGTIARFNVMHSRDVAGTGQTVDMGYLCWLGPAALPALDALAAAKTGAIGWQPQSGLPDCGQDLELLHAARMEDWRAWTFRSYRLKQYLEGRTTSALAEPRQPAD